MKLNFRLNAPQRLLPINNVLSSSLPAFLLSDFKRTNAFLNHAVTFIDVRLASPFGVRFTLLRFCCHFSAKCCEFVTNVMKNRCQNKMHTKKNTGKCKTNKRYE